MKNPRLNWKIGICTAAIALAGACVDLDVTNLNDPDRERALSSASDVEALISGGFQAWWATAHYSYPGPAMSTAADAHSSSWGNWGMRDAGWEPRKAYNNDPAYSYNNVAETPWAESYQALAAVRDGLLTIEDGVRIQEGDGPDNTERLQVFGKFIQAMSLANLAVVFDQAFIVDETVDDVLALDMQSYTVVWAAAEQKFNEVIQMANGAAYTLPSNWVAFNGDWSGTYMAEVARAYKARYATQVPRTAAERDALNWSGILADASAGISRDFAGYYEEGGNWAWHRSKLHTATYTGWARIDYRTIGPSDASGKWETWINDSPDDKRPFDIDTDDSRITAPGDPQANGQYIRYMGNSPFPADRGIYHYSNYIDWRWAYTWYDFRYETFWPDMTPLELEFIAAEANYHLGNHAATMETVNKYRTTSGELPPFTDVNGVAPGGDRCVPKMNDGSCGNLWEAYKFEKRMEVHNYGMGTEYFDDRAWGDLVQYSWTQLPIPGIELDLLLLEIYSFGGPGGNSSAPDILGDLTPEGIRKKLKAIELWRQVQDNADAEAIERRR
jgi:hypothetical protein